MKATCAAILTGCFFLLHGCSPTPSAPAAGAGDSLSRSVPATPGGQPVFLQGDESATKGEITLTADESLRPWVEAQVALFEHNYPRAKLNVVYLPGEEAIARMLASDSIRLALTTRAFSKAEVAALGTQNIQPRLSAVALEGIALLVHPSNTDTTLTRVQLENILTGKADNWRSVNPASKLGEIDLVFDHPRSGVISFLHDSLLGGQSLRKDQIYAQKNTPDVISYVATHPQAIGFAGWSWLSDVDDPQVKAWRSQVKVLWLERPAEAPECAYDATFFGPYQSFLVQQCYPLTRVVFTQLREPTMGLGTGFVSFLDGNIGQRATHKAGMAATHSIPRRVGFPRLDRARPIQ